MNRSETRKTAFELIYSLEIQKVSKEEYEEQIELFLQTNQIEEKKVKDYIEDTIYGIEKNKEKILDIINQELSEKWELNRLSKVSLAILKIATYELMYKEVPIPYKVVVNEAVELAKTFGDDNAPSFVNGILASIIKNNNIEGATKE